MKNNVFRRWSERANNGRTITAHDGTGKISKKRNPFSEVGGADSVKTRFQKISAINTKTKITTQEY